MANYRVDMYIPNMDSAGNSIDPTPLEKQIEPLALGGNTLYFQGTTMMNNGAYVGQGILLLFVIADTNVSQAQAVYTTFINGLAWGTNKPHYIAVVAAAVS